MYYAVIEKSNQCRIMEFRYRRSRDSFVREVKRADYVAPLDAATARQYLRDGGDGVNVLNQTLTLS